MVCNDIRISKRAYSHRFVSFILFWEMVNFLGNLHHQCVLYRKKNTLKMHWKYRVFQKYTNGANKCYNKKISKNLWETNIISFYIFGSIRKEN